MKFLVVLCLVTVALAAYIEEEYEKKKKALQNPKLYDGDMAGINGPHDAERNAIPEHKYRWHHATIPYEIDDELIGFAYLIYQAFANYHDNTCVRFVPRTDEKDYIKIFSGEGCYSHVGRTGKEQPVSLGDGCMYVGTIVHELGHAVGFYHEQSRSDRDEHITIHLENVEPGMEFNFDKLAPNQNILYNTFDYDGIMLYGNDAFSKDGNYTMVSKNGKPLLNPFDKDGMTDSDIERVNKMYNCKK